MPKLLDEGMSRAANVPTGILNFNITAPNFKIDPSLFNLVRRDQYGGTPSKNPAKRINKFCNMCQMITHENVIKMMFPQSLKDKALS
ncbi:hypothetical protein vseg_018273 [Gypsophila vaccaria]